MPALVGSISCSLDVYLSRVHVEFLSPDAHLLLFLRHPAVNRGISTWWLWMPPSPISPRGPSSGEPEQAGRVSRGMVNCKLSTELWAFQEPSRAPWGGDRGMMGPVRTWAPEAAPEHKPCYIYILLGQATRMGPSISPPSPRPPFPSLQEPPAAPN